MPKRHIVTYDPCTSLCGIGRPYCYPPGDTYVIEDDDFRKYPITCHGCRMEASQRGMLPEYPCETCRSFAENFPGSYPTDEEPYHPDCPICQYKA